MSWQRVQQKLNIELYHQHYVNQFGYFSYSQTWGVQRVSFAALFSDRKSVMAIVPNHVLHEKTKHIDIDCYFLRDLHLERDYQNTTC